MNHIGPTSHSLRYRKIAKQAFKDIIRPYLQHHHPELIEKSFFAVCSSVAYGLADEYSDIDTILIIPEEEYNVRETEWVNWAFGDPEIATFRQRTKKDLRIGISTWHREDIGVLFDGQGSWDDFYNDHLHWVQNLIPIYDPCDQMQIISDSLARMPQGFAERAADRYAGQLEDIRCNLGRLSAPTQKRFVGLLSYSIVNRALPLLFHRENVPLPFHKWQWALAKHLGAEAQSILEQLRVMLEEQMHQISFPEGLISKGAKMAVSLDIPLPMGIKLSQDQFKQALASVQWHLQERGCYQMVRARARGWHESSLKYLCATRCLLIKGAILLETEQVSCGENVSVMWDNVHENIPGLEDCIWPRKDEDPFEKTLQGINIFRERMEDKHALPHKYLENPLSCPPSYDLACILEEL